MLVAGCLEPALPRPASLAGAGAPPPQVYASHFALPNGMPYVQSNTKPRPGAPHLLGTTPEIEELRPKSPPR